MLHRSDDERTRAATAFARAARDDGARLMYIAGDAPADRTLDAFADAGLDVGPAIASGRLAVRDADATYLASGIFDADAVLATMRRESDAATRDGWSGLRVAGEMGWARGRVDAVLAYERLVDDVFRETDAAGLCLYDASGFGPGPCEGIARTHPLVLAGDEDGSGSGWELLRIERGADGALVVRGEVDLSNADSLVASLRSEAARTPHLRLDLGGLRFAGGRALRAIHAVGADHAREGGRMSLVAASPLARTAMATLGLADEPWLEWAAAAG